MGAVGEVPGTECGEHVLQLHRTEGERLTGLTAWVRRGLDLGEKVICPELPRRSEDSLVALLEAHGVDGVAAAREGRLAVLPVEDFYAGEGHAAAVERALADGFPAVCMWGAEHLARSVLSPAAYRVVEEQMDELVRARPVHTLCQYPQARNPEPPLEDVVAVHRSGVRQAIFGTTQDLDGLALYGDVDATTTEVFEAVLAVATRSAAGVLWLDLAELSHLDAGDCWRLDDATRRFRISGGHVLLVAPRPAVEAMLQLMEVDQLPGMHVLAGRS